MGTFKQFMKLFEDDMTAPSAGVPKSPDSPESSESKNKNHFDALDNIGIDVDAAIEGGIITVYKIPKYNWGFSVMPPVQAEVEKLDDGNYSVRFMLADKKLLSPRAFYHTYNKGQRPAPYEGSVEDKTEVMTKDELQDVMAAPLEGMGAGMGGPPPGMGGGPPGMGGMA